VLDLQRVEGGLRSEDWEEGSGNRRYAPAPPFPFPSFTEWDTTSSPFEKYDPAFPGVWAAEGEGMEWGVESGGYGGSCERVEGAQGAVTVLGLLVFG
jgi:hypothetical protein